MVEIRFKFGFLIWILGFFFVFCETEREEEEDIGSRREMESSNCFLLYIIDFILISVDERGCDCRGFGGFLEFSGM